MARKAKFAFVEERSAAIVQPPEEQSSLIARLDKAGIEVSRSGDHRSAQDIHTLALRLAELRNVLSDARASVPDDLIVDVEKLIALI